MAMLNLTCSAGDFDIVFSPSSTQRLRRAGRVLGEGPCRRPRCGGRQRRGRAPIQGRSWERKGCQGRPDHPRRTFGHNRSERPNPDGGKCPARPPHGCRVSDPCRARWRDRNPPPRVVGHSDRWRQHCPWHRRNPSLRSFHAVPSLSGVRKGFQTFQRTSILPCLSVEGYLRMRKPQASQVSYLRRLPNGRAGIKWTLEGWPHPSQGRVCDGPSIHPPSRRRGWLCLRTHSRRRGSPWSAPGRW